MKNTFVSYFASVKLESTNVIYIWKYKLVIGINDVFGAMF